jgi:hypothetical protein
MGKGRWDSNTLAAELECSKRTVYRLLQTLSLAGVPWYFDEACRAYRVRTGFKFPITTIMPEDNDEPNNLNGEMIRTIDRLIADGELFTQSLRKFRTMFKSPESGKQSFD